MVTLNASWPRADTTLVGGTFNNENGYFANREELNGMFQNSAIHKGLHCLLRRKNSEKEIQHFCEIITCDP